MVKRLHTRFDHLHWMKLSEVARYWAARELTRLEPAAGTVKFRAPFACPGFTVRIAARATAAPTLIAGSQRTALEEVSAPLKLTPGKWCRDGDATIVCFALPKGSSQLTFA